MLVATENTAIEAWKKIRAGYEKAATIGNLLNEIKEATSRYYKKDPINFSKESFLKHINFEDTNPEDIFQYINWTDKYIDDEYIDMGLNYWKDEMAFFSWDVKKDETYTPLGPGKAELIYELGTGGPNIHLVFAYDLKYPDKTHFEHGHFEHGVDIPEPEFQKSEFQYHWWSPLYIIDTTEDTVAKECLSQIEEEALELFEKNYEHPITV